MLPPWPLPDHQHGWLCLPHTLSFHFHTFNFRPDQCLIVQAPEGKETPSTSVLRTMPHMWARGQQTNRQCQQAPLAWIQLNDCLQYGIISVSTSNWKMSTKTHNSVKEIRIHYQHINFEVKETPSVKEGWIKTKCIFRLNDSETTLHNELSLNLSNSKKWNEKNKNVPVNKQLQAVYW